MSGIRAKSGLDIGIQSLTARMVAVAAAHEQDPEVAYLCVWAAITRLVTAISRHDGVRPQFSLRRNGTLRVRKVGGIKLPEVMPAREDHQWRAAIRHLLPEDVRDLLSHKALRVLATRTPLLNGKPVLRDAYGQRPVGVLDVALTRDPRYPVWHTLDLAALDAALAAPDVSPDNCPPLWDATILLRAVHSNLFSADGDANAAVARLALPVARLLAEALMRATGRIEAQ
jgi:hypothetical protein